MGAAQPASKPQPAGDASKLTKSSKTSKKSKKKKAKAVKKAKAESDSDDDSDSDSDDGGDSDDGRGAGAHVRAWPLHEHGDCRVSRVHSERACLRLWRMWREVRCCLRSDGRC